MGTRHANLPTPLFLLLLLFIRPKDDAFLGFILYSFYATFKLSTVKTILET
jgi:hypothetical protein